MPYIYKTLNDGDDETMARETLRDIELRHMRIKVRVRTLVEARRLAAIGDKPAIDAEIALLRAQLAVLETDAAAVLAANPTL